MKNIFVSEKHFRNGVTRLLKHGGILKFLNREKSFQVVLRVLDDYDVPSGIDDVIEIGISATTYNKTLPDALLNSDMAGGYLELDIDTFFFSQYENILRDNSSIEPVMQECNTLYNAVICPCGTRVIHDAQAQCCFCEMIDDDTVCQQRCIICHGHSPETVMTCVPCCNTFLHQHCLDEWKVQSPSCPLCRCDLTH